MAIDNRVLIAIGIIVVLVIFLGIYRFQQVSTSQIMKTTESTKEENQNLQVREIRVRAFQFSFDPKEIRVKEGERVRLIITSEDVPHGFSLPDFGINEYLAPGKETIVEFTANKKGTFEFRCSVFCGTGHSNMRGVLIVE